MRVKVTKDAVLAAFDALKDDPSFSESRKLVEEGGMPVEMLQAMSLRPELLRSFASFGASVYPGGLLERPLKEWVILQASRRNNCQFCTRSHEALTEQLSIASRPPSPTDQGVEPRVRCALRYTDAMLADANSIPADVRRELHDVFSEPEIVELTFLVGFIQMLNMFNNALEVRYHGEYAAKT